MKYLYLDDIRFPKTDRDWIIVRSTQEAINYVHQYGVPDYISFDHDLGQGIGKEGSDFARWIVEYDLDSKGTAIPENFEFNVHSANPEGAKEIRTLLDNYLKFRKNARL